VKKVPRASVWHNSLCVGRKPVGNAILVRSLSTVLAYFPHFDKRNIRFERSVRWSSEFFLRPTVRVSDLPLGPLTRFYLALLSSSENYFILLSKAPSLTRRRVCSLQCNHTLVRLLTPNNHTLPSHLRLCSLFVACLSINISYAPVALYFPETHINLHKILHQLFYTLEYMTERTHTHIYIYVLYKGT
jgi:hypothetical protein